MIKVVSFDLGKTLIRPSIQNCGLCRFLADSLNIPYIKMKSLYSDHFLERRISLLDFCSSIGLDKTEQIQLFIKKYYSERGYNDVYDDVLFTLSKLKSEGYSLICISNKPYCNSARLSTYNLESYFDAEIYSCDVGIVKPRLQIFQYAQSLLGISSSEIVHVGDSLKTDIKGAVTANWHAVYIDRSLSFDRVEFDEFKLYNIINTLAQLPQIIDVINSKEKYIESEKRSITMLKNV